jgi:hypothetical protein
MKGAGSGDDGTVSSRQTVVQAVYTVVLCIQLVDSSYSSSPS